MPDTALTFAVVTQSVVAGFVGALSILQLVWWRSDRGRSGSGWLLTWTVAIAVLFLVNAPLSVLGPGPSADTVMFVRAQVLAGCLLLAMPAVRAFTDGPPVRVWVLVAAAAFVVRAVVWLSTDLILVGAATEAPVARGPLAVPTFLPALAAVCVYVVVALRGVTDRRTRRVIGATSVLSVVLLLLPYVLPVSMWTSPLTVAWTLPLASGLTALGLRRLALVERETRRQHRRRDALARLGSTALSATDTAALLEEAEALAREETADPTVRVAVRPQPDGRFSTQVGGAGGGPVDAPTRGFFDDLGRIVSIAAERMSLARHLEQAAFTDSLTGLPNRHALERHLVQALPRAAERGTRLAVLSCDVDGFKVENEMHGHAWGDHLLRRAADHLRACAGRDAVVARFGGDEFVVVLETLASDDALVHLAHRIRDGLTTDHPDRSAPRLSAGIAVWCPETAPVPDHLLRQADTAMLEAKRTRAGVVVFDAALRARMQAQEELRRELHVALVDDEMTVHYQPVIQSATMRVVGVEALARWEHGGRTRMPGEWLPFAEESGLIVPIGRRVLTVARAGAARMGLPVMVNVAARQLAEPSFLEQLMADLGVVPGRGSAQVRGLTLEITESALLQDLPQVVTSLSALRERGVRIAIDDFGTGYSSFARLATLPVDVLKIDRAFVAEVATDEGRAVVRAILALAEAYRLDVVAEGVETPEQLDELVALGVPKLQGYLLGRPAPGRPSPVVVPRPTGARGH